MMVVLEHENTHCAQLLQAVRCEDQCVAAEVALLQAHGHEVIPYNVHNDAIDTLGRLEVASRTIWSRAAYHEIRELIRTHRPDIAHFNNTFPLISPAAYYAARAEGVGVVQTLHNFRLLCPNALFFRDGRVCEDCLGRRIPWPGVVHKCYRGSGPASAAVATLLTVHRALGTRSTHQAVNRGGVEARGPTSRTVQQ